MMSRIASLAIYVVLPVVGIAFFDWDWRSIILLYWLENVTVGLRNVITMIRSPRISDPGQKPVTLNGISPTSRAAKPATIIFFIFHYGIFTTVHGAFVMIIIFFGGFGFSSHGLLGGPVADPIDFNSILLIWAVGSVVQVVGDFFTRRDALPAISSLFMRPYARIFALHITIVGGAWIIARFEWPPSAAILLVVVHFLLDIGTFFKQRQSQQP